VVVGEFVGVDVAAGIDVYQRLGCEREGVYDVMGDGLGKRPAAQP
jgi:hypothetical protein